MQISCKESKSDGVCKTLFKLLRGTKSRKKRDQIIFNIKSSQEHAQGVILIKKNQSRPSYFSDATCQMDSGFSRRE